MRAPARHRMNEPTPVRNIRPDHTGDGWTRQYDGEPTDMSDAWSRAIAERNWSIFAITRPEDGTGKLGKYPTGVVRSEYAHERGAWGQPLSIYDAACWTFSEAWEQVKTLTPPPGILRFAVGYLPRPGSALVVGDLDACRDPLTGIVEPWAAEILALGSTYAEVSTSGTGVRLLMERQPGDDQHTSGERADAGFFANGSKGAVLTFNRLSEAMPAAAPEVRDAILRRKGVDPERNHRVDGQDYGEVGVDLLRAVVMSIPNDGRYGYDDWVAVGHAIQTVDDGQAGWEIFRDWSEKFPGKRTENTVRKWQRGLKANGTVGFGTLVYMARGCKSHADGGRMPPEVEAMLDQQRIAQLAAKMPPSETVLQIPGVGSLSDFRSQVKEMDPLAPDVVAMVIDFKARGLTMLVDMIVDRARESRCLTQFNKAVRVAMGQQRADEVRQTEDRKFYNVNDPNTFIDIAEDIERRAGEAEMGFVLGRQPVIMKTMESAFGRVVMRDPFGNKIVTPDGEPVTEPAMTSQARLAKSSDLRRIASKLGYFFSIDGDGVERPADAPGSMIQHLDAVAGQSWPAMKGIVQHPVMWRGQLLFGDRIFHRETGLFLQTGALQVEQWSDPVAAYRYLVDEWLGDFAFASDLDRAAALMFPASMLVAKTGLIDQPGPPIFLDTAPFPGTGKSLKTSVCFAAITGSPAPTSIYPESPEEREKVIVASIMEGQTALMFDNLKTGMTLGNAHHALAQLTTTPVFEGRVLGLSEKFIGPAGLVIAMNGNNVVPQGDMISRTVEVRHDPDHRRNLAQRRFRHADLMKYTLSNRGKIVGALACILSQRIDNSPPGRFPVWSKLVAEPIIAASGVQGFYDTWVEAGEVETVSAGSPGFAQLVENLSAFMFEWRTGKEIADKLNTNPNLRLAVFRQNEPVTSKEVTSYLQRHAGWVVDGKQLAAQRHNLGTRTDHKKRWVFRVG